MDRNLVQNFDQYAGAIRAGNDWSQKNVGLQNLDLRFSMRMASVTQAYQEGIYRMRTILNDGRKQFAYGRFSVYLVMEDGKWKILMDTDQREGVSEKDFLQLME